MTDRKDVYAFGPFRFDRADRLLWRGGDPLPLTPKSGELLDILLESAGRVVARDDLMRRLWPDTFVEEANLSHHVYRIREALGQRPEGGEYIETLARRGYRFVAPVTRQAPEPAVAAAVGVGPSLSDVGPTLPPDVGPTFRSGPVTGAPTSVPARPEGRAYISGSRISGRRRWMWLLGGGAVLAVIATAVAMLWRPAAKPLAALPAPPRSLAVLPFAPFAGASQDEALSFGMAAAVITRLTKVDAIVVRPVSAIVKYGDAGRDVLAAAREQQVDAVLDAHLQRADDRVRVTVQLIRTSDGRPIWANTFDEPMQGVFAIQDAIAEKVVSALQVPLTREGWGRLAIHDTTNMAAYQAYLSGAFHLGTFAPGGFERSVVYLNEAIRLEPNYARAHAGLAYAYAELAGINPNPAELVRLAKAHAEKARALDETLPELHQALINIRQYHDWDWPGVEAECQRLIALAPGFAESYQMHGWALSLLGKFDEGLAELRRAQAIDPNSSSIAGAIGSNLTWSGHLDAAREETRRLIAADPGATYASSGLALIELLQGHAPEAVRLLEAAIVPPTIKAGQLAYAYGVAGRRADAEAQIVTLKELAANNQPTAFQIAQGYAGLGDHAQALDWLERAYREHSLWMAWLKVDPSMNLLRSEPRFQALMTKLNY